MAGICRRGSIYRVAALLLAATALPRLDAEEVATTAAVRADGTLLVDGRPVFPVGMHTEDATSMAPLAEAGFNFVSGTGEWNDEHYAAARDQNLIILGGHYVWATFATFRGEGGIDLRPSEEAGLQNVLAHGRDWGWRMPLDTLATHDPLPGVIGWRTNEEPEARLAESIEYAYEIFKSHSPSHIVATLSCDPRWFHMFRNTADVLIVDNYPFRAGTGAKRSLLETYDWIRRGVEAMDGKAVWLMPQLMPPSYWSRKPTDELSLADMRLQNYAGLIAGAKGVIMYNYSAFTHVYERDADGERTSRPAGEEVMRRRWEAVTSLAAELNELGPIICDARPTRELDIRWLAPGGVGPGPQMTRELDHYGKKYVLVASGLDVPIEGKIYGINGGNRRAYDASVFLGEGDLSVTTETPGEPAITVGPRGAGVFLLTRRPVALAE
ncbi:MAG TPA: hypothetical protein QGH10_23765 [Armatimonadota bacterium]|nr:hypothetical protein [Armatimonadota bacterium]